jgi:hypothetical protein
MSRTRLRHETITSLFDDDTRIQIECLGDPRISNGDGYRYNHRRHRQSSSPTSHHFVVRRRHSHSQIRAIRIQIECLGDRHQNPEFIAATDATDTIIIATVKVHRQQAITSSTHSHSQIHTSRIQIECLVIVATAKVHRQQAITSSFDDDTRIPESARVAFKLTCVECCCP